MARASVLLRPFHDWSSLHAQTKFIFDTGIPRGQATGTYERHGEYSAWLIRKGTARVRAGDRDVTAHKGQWVFCLANRIWQTFSADARLLSLRVENSWPQGELLFRGPPVIVLEAADHPHLERLALRLQKAVQMPSWRKDTPHFAFFWKTHITYQAYLEHQHRLLEWMQAVAEVLQANGYTMQVPGGVPEELAMVLNAIETADLQTPSPVPRLAQESGFTLRQLNRLCEKTIGHTLAAHWTARRVEIARQLLARSEVSVKEAASALGFTQLSHFSAWFKRHAGRPPREYHRNPVG